MKNELKLQTRIIKWLKELEGNHLPIYYEKRQAGGYMYHTGLPDLFIVINGQHIEIELKSRYGHRSTMQLKWEKIFTTVGIEYHCVKDFDEFKKIVEEHLSPTK